MIATLLLTGGRPSEVLALDIADVNFDRETVRIRGTKTEGSDRTMPLWPQLEEILRPDLSGPKPPARLLFPCFTTGREAMLTDFRKLLDAVSLRAGWQPGEIRSKMFRHSYRVARLQTLDQGAAISPFTVSRELGHGSFAMVQRVYGHLGQVRHRADVVEYRVEQHAAASGERLAALVER